ncbi:hypothetical protein [Paraburkholderia caribensis]|uniref:hypothetical protein n=1 Tax=Paraburkholderia caribensis TaxID=75105 RepID=UPI002090BCB5|nr:hypothetical protein [Paraburkholderia caribensis]MCO4880227.1 hypothetical protein [Paraburkholderia caribensis]
MAVDNLTTIGGDQLVTIDGTSDLVTIGFQLQPVQLQVFKQSAVTKQIYAYLYQDFNDDPALIALYKVFNSMAQEYIDWFNNINLPVYAGNPELNGLFLDWVLTGLYGIPRPVLPANMSQAIGPYNTFAYNEERYGEYTPGQVQRSFTTTDDIYKRIATWNLYKGDGMTFTVPWLKRRIKRFLTGVDGTDGASTLGISTFVDNTHEISVEFTGAQNATITVDTSDGQYQVMWDTLKAALRSGACQLPFQYQFNLV